MSCSHTETAEGIALKGPENGRLRGVEADMHACSDQAITLLAIARFADAPVAVTGIRGISGIRKATVWKRFPPELARLGIRCEQGRTA